jgi:hypothetical protein
MGQVAKLLALGADAATKGSPTKGVRNPVRAIRKVKASSGIKPCRIPGCGRPSKGPRYQFLCEDHRALPKSEVARLLASPTPDGKSGGKARGTQPARRAKRSASAQAAAA